MPNGAGSTAVLTEGVVQASSMLKPLSSTTASVPSASPQNAQKQGTPAQSQQQPNPTKQAKAQGH